MLRNRRVNVLSPVICLIIAMAAASGGARSSSSFRPDAEMLLNASSFVGIVRTISRQDVYAGEVHCGYVYVGVVRETILGSHAIGDPVAIFSALDQEFDDFSTNYLVFATVWENVTPVWNEADYEAIPELLRPGSAVSEGECIPAMADYFLSSSELQLAFPIHPWPSEQFGGLWVWQDRASVLSEVELVRSARLGTQRAYYWGDLVEQLRIR